MEANINLKLQKNQAFKIALAEIRPKLALFNGILIILAIGGQGARNDYLISCSYIIWSLFWWLIPTLNRLGMKLLRFPLFLTDLTVIGYLMTRTGGLNSELYSFLFLPVLASAVRCQWSGILVWSSIMAGFLVMVSYLTRTLNLATLLIKIGYLYLAGFFSGSVIQGTFVATETVSRKLVQLNANLQKLNDFSQDVSGSSDLEAVFNRIIKAVHQNNPALAVAVTFFDEEGGLKIWDSSWEKDWLLKYKAYPLNRNSITLAPILVFREPLLDLDINKHPELIRTFEGIPIRSLSIFPIIVAGEVAGALIVTDLDGHLLSESEVQILTSIAKQAGIALQNIASLNAVKQQADTDGLTGLYNRRYFEEKLEELVFRALREGSSLSLIMIDVDDFKKYNDEYGHPSGDLLLKVVARVLSDVVREGDIVARYGGEEFAVILQNSGQEVALQIAERIRASVAGIPAGILKSPITVSLGVGTLPDHAKDRASLVDFVDRSLYYAKQIGKNHVACGFKFKATSK